MIGWLTPFLTPRLFAAILLLLLTWACARPARSAPVIYCSIWLAGLASAAAALDSRVAPRLGGILAGLGMFAGSWWLGNYWSRSVLIWMSGEGIPYPWRWAALVRIGAVAAGIALASEATGFATTLIRNAFLILLAGVTAAAVFAALPHLRTLWSANHGAQGREPEDPLLR